ncbi:MAG: hypothetical protein ACERKN_07040 [Velocimicrobium sp.]
MNNAICRLAGGGADVSPVNATASDVLAGKVIVDSNGNPLPGIIPIISTTVAATAINSDGTNIRMTPPAQKYYNGGQVYKPFTDVLAAHGATQYSNGTNVAGTVTTDNINALITPPAKSYMNGGGVYASVSTVLSTLGASRYERKISNPGYTKTFISNGTGYNGIGITFEPITAFTPRNIGCEMEYDIPGQEGYYRVKSYFGCIKIYVNGVWITISFCKKIMYSSADVFSTYNYARVCEAASNELAFVDIPPSALTNLVGKTQYIDFHSV